MKISIIVATAQNNVIGSDNKLLWHIPADLKYFKHRTLHHHVIMGRKTHNSIGKPLPERTNIIITRQQDLAIEGCIVFNDLNEAIAFCRQNNEVETFIIGGAEIYRQSLAITDKIYLTKVHALFEGDAFFPELDMNEWRETSRQSFSPDEKNPYPYDFLELERKVTIQS